MSGAMANGSEQQRVNASFDAVVSDLEERLRPSRDGYLSPRTYSILDLLPAGESAEDSADVANDSQAQRGADDQPTIPARHENQPDPLLTPLPVAADSHFIPSQWQERLTASGVLPGPASRVFLSGPNIADLPTGPMPAVNVQPTIARIVAAGSNRHEGAVRALVRGWAEIIPERLVQPGLFPEGASYDAEPYTADNINAWNALAGVRVDEAEVVSEAVPEDMPYDNGSHFDEYINAWPELIARLRRAGKAAVTAWLNRSRHVEPDASPAPAPKQETAREAKPWQPMHLEIAPPEHRALIDVPEAFAAEGMEAQELFNCLTPRDRVSLVLDLASQTGWAAFRDAMHPKHSLTPNLSDPVEAKFLRDGQEAYEQFRTAGGPKGFEEFMTCRRASVEFNRTQGAMIAAYERGELTIKLNPDVARQLRDLNIATQESERYYEGLMSHEDRNPEARAKRDEMRNRVAMARNRLLTKIVVA